MDKKTELFLKAVEAVKPDFEGIKAEIQKLKSVHNGLITKDIADVYMNRLRTKYTSVGIATALPSVIPGIGTAAQLTIEAGGLSADLVLMMRWMAAGAYGVGLLFEKDIKDAFTQEFIITLGLWSGAVEAASAERKTIQETMTGSPFSKDLSDRMFKQLLQKVALLIFSRYGGKRLGTSIGRMIPFGVGAAVGGAFNFAVMSRYKTALLKYYENEEFVVKE